MNSLESCAEGGIRLPQYGYFFKGRVQLCKNGTWGGICSDYFDVNDADVVCRQLGYFSYGNFYCMYFFLLI